MSGPGLSIGQPWVLWGLVACVLLVLFTWRSRVVLSRRMLALTTLTRILTVALLLLAVADTRARWPTRRLAVGFAVDESRSVSSHESSRIRRELHRIRAERSDVSWVEVRPQTDRSRSDLEAQLSAALGALPTDRVRRVLLATDGRENTGDIITAADRARREGVQVFVLPAGDRPPVDGIAVVGLDAPRLVRAGRSVSAGVRLYASTPREVNLEVLRDGERVATRSVHAAQGASVHDVELTFPDEGVHVLELRASTPDDSIAENNTWRTLVRVVSPPRVLLVHENQGAEPVLTTVLRDARLRVDVVRANDVPDDAEGWERYQFAVFDELTLTTLNEAQQSATRTWVEERGGGLLITTGTHAVQRDPERLREIEPVIPPRAIPEPRPLELILVIDRSGSMTGAPMANARQGAIAAVRALRIDARVGYVAFSGEADVVAPPVPMSQAQDVIRGIAGIQAGGGTDIGAALEAANNIISRDSRYLHHVILLSDGESDPEPAYAAARNIVAAGATITTITLGPRNELMQTIARIGRGRYHVTQSASSLPALFVREAQYRLPPPSREMRFVPRVASARTWLDGVDFEPQLGGFVLSDLRPGADAVLLQPEGGPLLAHWYVGLGQVASWTSATSGRWVDAWRTGAGFRRLFSQMAWEMLRAQPDDALELYVTADRQREGVRKVTVVSPGLALTPLPIVTLSRGGASRPLALRPRGPGVWEVEVPLESGFLVDARLPTSPEPTVAAAADAPYADELRGFGADRVALEAIARAGGGRVLRRAEDVFGNVRAQRVLRDLRVPLLVAALVTYLLGVLFLRMPGGGRMTSTGVATPRPSAPAHAPQEHVGRVNRAA